MRACRRTGRLPCALTLKGHVSILVRKVGDAVAALRLKDLTIPSNLELLIGKMAMIGAEGSPETDNEMLKTIVESYELNVPFDDLDRDISFVYEALIEQIGNVRLRTNFQIQVLNSLFYRNKGAYIVGKVINGFRSLPFAIPILHNSKSRLYIDAALFGEDDLLALFSFARAYFMVYMPVPSAYVQFLRTLMLRMIRQSRIVNTFNCRMLL